MNENAKKWVAALRSGEYEQGVGRLRMTDGRYCCLGVACDLYGRAYGIDWAYCDFMGERYSLPQAVKNWLGLTSSSGCYRERYSLPPTISRPTIAESLVEKNDAGRPFAEIADIIESEPEGLFRQEGI